MATAFLNQVQSLLTYELTNSTRALLATSTTIGGSAAATATVAADFVAPGGPTLTGGVPFPGKSYIDSTSSSYIVNAYASPGTVIDSSNYYTGYTFRFTLPSTGAANWTSGFTYRVRYSPREEIVFYTEDGNYQNAYLRQGGSIVFNLFSNVTPTAGLTYILQVSNGLATLSKIVGGQVTLLGSAVMTKQPQKISMTTGAQGTGFSDLYFSGTPMPDDTVTIVDDYRTHGDPDLLYDGNPFGLQKFTPGVNWTGRTFRCGDTPFTEPFTTPQMYSRFQWRTKLIQGTPADYTFYVDRCQLSYTANDNMLTMTNLDTNETSSGAWEPASNAPLLIVYNRGVIQVINMAGNLIGATSMNSQFAQIKSTLSVAYDGFDDMYFTSQGEMIYDDYLEVADDWRQNGGTLLGNNPFVSAQLDPMVIYTSTSVTGVNSDQVNSAPHFFDTPVYNRFTFRLSLIPPLFRSQFVLSFQNPADGTSIVRIIYSAGYNRFQLVQGSSRVGPYVPYHINGNDCVYVRFNMGRLQISNLSEDPVIETTITPTVYMRMSINFKNEGLDRMYFRSIF